MFTKSVCLLISLAVQISFWNVGGAGIPNYIKLCKRDQDTIDDCVKNSIEVLRPKLRVGIPELKVPAIEPLTIPEVIIDQGNVIRFKAVGRDVKVHGASDFKLKSLEVDLDLLQIKGRVFLPHLEIIGKYDVDARLLVVPIHGKGDILANATNCIADVFLQAALENRNGDDYLRFNTVAVDLDIQDYTLRLSNLFSGEAQLGEVANQVVQQNRAQFLHAAKPYIERTVASIFKKIANKIAGTAKYDDILPL